MKRTVVCECSHRRCRGRIVVDAKLYEDLVLRRDRRFIVLPEHIRQNEHVVRSNDTYAIVYRDASTVRGGRLWARTTI